MLQVSVEIYIISGVLYVIVEYFEDLPLLCKNNFYLMNYFAYIGFRKEELKRLNFVQKSLCVFTLSDTVTVEGNKISDQVKGIESNCLSEDTKCLRVQLSFLKPS